LFWTTCSGNNPTSALVDAVAIPLDVLSNTAGTGVYDKLETDYPNCYSQLTVLGAHLPPGATACSGSYCTSRQTIYDFGQLFGCPDEVGTTGNSAYSDPEGTAVKAGGLNSVYRSFVYGALCTDLIDMSFWLYAALTGSALFIIAGWWILPCSLRNLGVEKEEGEKDEETGEVSNAKEKS